MTDGIGRLAGYGGYNIGGYMPPKKGETSQENIGNQPAITHNYEETQVDPAKVMEFMANNQIFVAAPKVADVQGVDESTEDRVAGYMEQFEMIYGIIQEEFGEELAPAVMNIVMDKLMGMTE